MEHILKYTSGAIMSLLALLAPIRPLILCAIIFVGIDFVTGVMASYKRARKQQSPWAFESEKAWATITKLSFVLAGIVLSWLIDSCILSFMHLNLANLFTGFVCGVEFWSYLENAAEISNHPIFTKLKKYMKTKIDKGLDNE